MRRAQLIGRAMVGLTVLAAFIVLSIQPLHAAEPAARKASRSSRFTPLGDGTVKDENTGLIWLDDANAAGLKMPLNMADKFIGDMNSGVINSGAGYSDWRIPTIREFLSILDSTRFYPSLVEGHGFKNVQNDYYWTSSGGYNIVGYAWNVDLATGNSKYEYLSYCNFMYLWPVRGEGLNLPELETHLPPDDLGTYLSSLKCEGEASVGTAAPDGVRAMAVSSSEVVLSWESAGSEDQIAWYNIYEDNVFAQSTPNTQVSFANLQPGQNKCYQVASYSATGLESRRSLTVCAETWSFAAWGTVWSEGMNHYGQLGTGNTEDSSRLIRAKDLSDAIKVSGGVEHTLVLLSNGSVWAWGRNERGQLGTGDKHDRKYPVQVQGLRDIVDISAGWYHSLAVARDGSVWAWGRNYYGQLGTGSREDSLTPARVADIRDAKAVAAGWYHSMALLQDGNVMSWGWNIKGQLGLDGRDTVFTPVEVLGVRDIVMISGGMYHSLALKKDGQVLAWGHNEYGQIGDGTKIDSPLPVIVPGLGNVRYISAGMHHNLAITKNDTVIGWGRNQYGQLNLTGQAYSNVPVEIPRMSTVKLVAAGANHSLALSPDGGVILWGWRFSTNERNTPPTVIGNLPGIISIGAGLHFSSVLKGD